MTNWNVLVQREQIARDREGKKLGELMRRRSEYSVRAGVPGAHRTEGVHQLQEGVVFRASDEVVDACVRARVVALRSGEHRGHRHALLLEEGLELALDQRRVLQVELVPPELP